MGLWLQGLAMAPRKFPGRPTILLASADATLRRRIRSALSRAGFGCMEVGTKALLARRGRPQADLVILDLDLERIDIGAVCKTYGSAPVIALARRTQVDGALESGAVDCLVRPLHIQLLLHRVRKAIGYRATVDELERSRGEVAALSGELTELEASEASLRRIVEKEGPNALPHCEQFFEQLGEAILVAQPSRDPIALLCVHLDLGATLEPVPIAGSNRPTPEARERTLGALSRRLRECVRDRDTVGHLGPRTRDVRLARIGGEEFGILLPGFGRPHDASRIARRMQEALARPMKIEGRDVSVSSSWGISIWPADGATPEVLLEAAQAARHAAREEGEGRIRFFAAEMNAAVLQRQILESGLRRALHRDEFVVHYQPCVDLGSGRISGFEALVRWRHPELGLVPPGQFIPIAEETGLIVPIGERVLAVACAQNRAWQEQGLAPVRVGVNLSSVQFRDPELPYTIAGALADTGLAPEWLELELTESVLMHKAESTIAHLRRLEQMGVRLSIDDFGTGYSSLSYLKRFPMDALKIDQSFIREVTTRTEDAAITTSIVLMGKSLDLSVVAEGVETRSQLEFLRVIGCDQAQGYLFSRPIPAAEAGALLASGLPGSLAA